MKCKLEGCDNEVTQSGTGRPRVFCSPEHTKEHWNREAARNRGESTRVVISDIDEVARTGTCSVHGPGTRLWRIQDTYQDGRPRLRWKCSICAGVAREKSRKRYQGSAKQRAARLWHLYRLTPEALDALVLKQAGRCAICARELRQMNVDHEHGTKHVRGLLCTECNTGLGKLGDTIECIERALAYLKGA